MGSFSIDTLGTGRPDIVPGPIGFFVSSSAEGVLAAVVTINVSIVGTHTAQQVRGGLVYWREHGTRLEPMRGVPIEAPAQLSRRRARRAVVAAAEKRAPEVIEPPLEPIVRSIAAVVEIAVNASAIHGSAGELRGTVNLAAELRGVFVDAGEETLIAWAAGQMLREHGRGSVVVHRGPDGRARELEWVDERDERDLEDLFFILAAQRLAERGRGSAIFHRARNGRLTALELVDEIEAAA